MKQAGWYKVRQRGSHIQFYHDDNPATVTVPHPKKDIHISVIKSIEKQAGIKLL